MDLKKLFAKSRKKPVFFALAGLVVLLTINALALPAVTLDQDAAEDDPAVVTETAAEEQKSDELENVADPFLIEQEREEALQNSENEQAEETAVLSTAEQEPILSDPTYFYDDTTSITVTVEAPEGAFPAGTVMKVLPIAADDVKDIVSDTLDNANVGKIVAVDITFYDVQGNEIEPMKEIRVSLAAKMIKTSSETQVVHIDNDGNGQLVEQSDGESADDEVVFNTKEFSTYAVVVIDTYYLDKEGDRYKVSVSYGPDAQIPEGAVLHVEELSGEVYDEYLAQTAELLDAAGFGYARIFDIAILNGEGDHLDIGAPVNVSMELLDAAQDGSDFSVVHFGEETEIMDARTEGNAVEFATESFSAYAIVAGPQATQLGWTKITSLVDLRNNATTGLYIGTNGNRYLTGETAAHANGGSSIQNLTGIKGSASTRAYPTDDAVKYYFEPVEGTTDQFYIYCYDADNNKLYARLGGVSATNNVYSIQLTSNESQKTPCTLSISGSNWTIRFNNNNAYRWVFRNNIFDAQNSAQSFYIWNNSGTDHDTYGLDGKTYGLMYWVSGVNGKGLMNTSGNSGKLDALNLVVMAKAGNNDTKLYVSDSENVSLWTFHFIEGDQYYLTSVVDGSTKYLQISASGLAMVSEPDDDCKIKVTPGTGTHAGEVTLKVGSRTLTYSGDISTGFGVGGTAGLEWLHLIDERELTNDYIMTYSANKVSVSDPNITNGSRIIVYTRVWNEDTKKYEFYAVDHDGTLVRCYESGDTIEWASGRLNSMLWNFVEYYWEGTTDPNYYYELYNQYSEKYIAPQKSDDQILSPNTIGINMNGRRNGMYYSPIVAWDEGYYAYAGLKAEDGHVVSCPLSQADDFYFAIMEDIPTDDEVHTVPTVDHKPYGITMKMVNFGTDLYPGNNDNNVRAAMTSFLGSNNIFTAWDTEKGLLNTTVGADGYPVTKAGNSLSEWFADAQEVNHLFIASTYNGTGYYEYDSVQNFAHLDPETNDFVVYKELGSDAVTGDTHKHGLFFPYNDITAGVFSVNKNTTTIAAMALPESDPRKYEALYQVQKSNTNFAPDYYFGMELTATFTQTPSGLDDWGHDIIYEFTGDDDFWLFVDGELIIDLGGIHSALAGSVNYKTGVVIVNGKETSLRELFESNYRGRNPEATDSQVEAYLDEIFDGEIFKDYTTHTMRIYYLERGAGSSNLHMRFNLASIKPGTVQLSKKLTGVEAAETVMAEFPYQIIYRTRSYTYDTDPDTGDIIKVYSDPSEDIYLTNDSHTGDPLRSQDHVFYKGTTTPIPYRVSYTAGGKTYSDVFILQPDDTADINFPTEDFPEGIELYDYRIIECGLNTAVYTGVKVNDETVIGSDVYQDDTLIEGRKDYGIDYASTDQRARVVYDNAVDPTALRNLNIKKRVFDVMGTTEIFEEDDDSVFDFRLYLASESNDIDSSPANMHTYHVLDPEGNYCYWSVDDQRLIPLPGSKKVFSEMSDAEKEAATFHTSMNGSISRIPIGYTIEVRDLLVGTKFKVVERPWEVPDGYSFKKYIYDLTEYSDAMTGVGDTLVADKGDPYVEVHNVKGFGLRVNKTWADEEFMAEREPVYFGLFHVKDGQDDLVADTLRQLPFGEESIYWYFDYLPVEGSEFTEYMVYEVKLSDPVVDSEGKVTSYGTMTILKHGDQTQLNGRQTGDTSLSPFTYTVEYGDIEVGNNDNVRVYSVNNTRPGIRLRKTDMNGVPLANAVFELRDTSITEEGKDLIGTFISDSEGFIAELYLRQEVDYKLTEITAPSGYHGLQDDLTIRLTDDGVNVSGTDEEYCEVSVEEDITTIIVKNRPYAFKAIKFDAGTKQPLANVTFALYREIVVDSVHSWDPNPYPGYDSLKTGSDGVIPKIDNTLPPGKYQLRETTPSGYQPLSGHVNFEVTAKGEIKTYMSEPAEAEFKDAVIDEDGTITYEIDIYNYKRQKVSVWKTDEGHNTIASGVSFTLYKAADYDDENEKPIEGAVAVMSGNIGQTGIPGILPLGELPVGEYRLVETKTVESYELPKKAIRIYVRNDGVSAMQSGSESEVATATNEYKQYYQAGQPNGTWQIRVWNSIGVELPHTGGEGTLIYRLSGLALLASAAYLYRRKAG